MLFLVISFENDVGYLLYIFLLKVFFDSLIEHIKLNITLLRVQLRYKKIHSKEKFIKGT